MNNFKKGDRVAFNFDKSTTGTVTSARKAGVRVLWDSGHETPVDPAELIHSSASKKNDRSALAKESATANESNNQKEEDSMIKSTGNQIQPPAGFRLIADNGPWDGEYHGPEAHQGNVSVTSRWNNLIDPRIEFDVYSSVDGHSNFNREELEAIPDLIEKVLAELDQAHAVEVMTAHPVPRANPEFHTVTEIAVWCDSHSIGAVPGFAAYQQLHAEELKDCDNA